MFICYYNHLLIYIPFDTNKDINNVPLSYNGRQYFDKNSDAAFFDPLQGNI